VAALVSRLRKLEHRREVRRPCADAPGGKAARPAATARFREVVEMTAHSNIYRLAVRGLLSSRVPRGIPRVAAYIALGAALTFVVIFLAVTTAHAQYPWTEADGKDVVFFAWKRVTCKDGVKYTMWQPYNTAEKRWLPFRRITPKPEGKMTVGEVDGFPDIFLDEERCMDDNPKGN
jgi:hypothetical protein